MNKFITYILGILVISLTFGCSDVGLEFPEPSGLKEYPILLHVTGSEETKITNSQNTLSWESDDIIQLTAIANGIEQADTIAVTELQCFTIDENNSSKASFSGFVSLRNAPRDCYFTYPAGAAMSVDPSSGLVKAIYAQQDGTHKPFLYGKSEYPEDPTAGMNVGLHHIGAVLELDIKVDGVTKVSFVGNKLEKLSPISINPDDHSLLMPNEAVTQITVPVQSEGKTYLFVPPVNLERGFSLICSNADATKYFIKSYSGSGANGGYDFSSLAKRGTMIPLEVDGEFVNFSVTTTDLTYTHNKNTDNLLTGTSVYFKMNLTGSSNKLIEGWGADLYDSDRVKIRSISSEAKIPNGEIVMEDNENARPLLKRGKYTLAPYYIMYGSKISLDSQNIDIADSGAFIEVDGITSYDKYKNNNLGDPNELSKRLTIEGIKVSTNVDLSIMKNYSVTLGGTSLGNYNSLTIKDGVMTAIYANQTKSEFGTYQIKASFDIGNLNFVARKDCHITGLPYTADFAEGNPTGWTPAWGFVSASYSNARVVLRGKSAVRTPKFYIPETTIEVLTYSDCRHNVTGSWGRKGTATLYIASCAAGATNIPNEETSLVFDTNYYQAAGSFDDVSGFDRKGYLICNTSLTLSTSKPSLMFSTSLGSSYLGSNTLVSFGHIIEYKK